LLYAETLRALLQANEVATEGKAKPAVVNIMAALKERERRGSIAQSNIP